MRPTTEGASRRSAGRYELGDLLGRGGMAEVFAGSSIGDHGFQKPVAIKRLLPELASDHVFVERLIDEAKLLVGMTHGNIVSVLDLARDGDDVFLVMEFVDGPSLRQLLKTRGARGLSLGVSTYIVQSAAAGLEFAHNRPGGAVIHADISPSNLLLTTSGEVRVADFGIARREGGGHGIVEGKWAYMAPEQARGEPLTPRSDVFALGVVLYELICGAHPFGRTVTHEERDSEPMRVIPPRVVRPSIPAGLEAICMRALAHDPRDRYKSMQALIDALVEERFASHFREAASDLAQAIREGQANPFAQNIRTQVTDRPLTLMTRSLLREMTPQPGHRPTPRSHSAPHYESRSEIQSQPEPGRTAATSFDHSEVPSIANPGTQTSLMLDELVRALEVPPVFHAGATPMPPVFRADGTPMPPSFRADGTPMPPFQSAESGMMLAAPDPTGVAGGHTMAGHQVAPAPPVRSGRLTFAILTFAALFGIGTAVAFHLDGEAAPLAQTGPEERKQVTPPPPPPPEPTAAPTAGDTKPPALTRSDVKSTSSETDPPGRGSIDARPPARPPAGEPRRPTGNPALPSLTPRVIAKKEEPGTLVVYTTPWAWVTVAGQKQATPAAKFKLAPGNYTVRLNFSTLGITETQNVSIESSKTFKLNINKDEE